MYLCFGIVEISLESTKDGDIHGVFERIEKNENGSLHLLINNAYDYDNLLKILHESPENQPKKPSWERSSLSNWDSTMQFPGLKNYCACLEYGSRYEMQIFSYQIKITR